MLIILSTFIPQKEYPESKERSLIFIRDLGMALFKTVIDGELWLGKETACMICELFQAQVVMLNTMRNYLIQELQ